MFKECFLLLSIIVLLSYTLPQYVFSTSINPNDNGQDKNDISKDTFDPVPTVPSKN